jgi:hypothetical protein
MLRSPTERLAKEWDFRLNLAHLGNIPLDRVDRFLDSLPHPSIRALYEQLYNKGNLAIFGLQPTEQ